MRPLRVAALAVLFVGAATAIWLCFGAFRFPFVVGPVDDAYHAVAKVRHELPFAVATGGAALLVYLAAGTGRSRGRWASVGLWLILVGAFSLLGLVAAEVDFGQSSPGHYTESLDAFAIRTGLLLVSALLTFVGLVGGYLLWLLAYRLDRPRRGR